MFFFESTGSIRITFASIKNDLKDIINDNKAFAKKEGWKTWAKEQNNHLRQELKNCADRTDEPPIAFMRDDNKPVYAFHIKNPSKSREYYFVCVLNGNILEGKALLCGGSILPEFVITNRQTNYLNAVPNPDYQLFLDNPNLIEYTLNGNKNNNSEEENTKSEYKSTNILNYIKHCYENHKRVSLPMRQFCRNYGYVMERSCVRRLSCLDTLDR